MGAIVQIARTCERIHITSIVVKPPALDHVSPGLFLLLRWFNRLLELVSRLLD